MADTDNIKHEAEDLKGSAKEKVGGLTGDEQMENEGRGEQVEAKVKKAGDSVADAASDAADSVKKALNH